MINLNSIIKRNTAHLLSSEIGDELIMMDLNGGNYINLNKVGRIIWEQIEHPFRVSDLVTALTSRFKVSHGQCADETLAYLQEMLAQQVIIVIE